MLLIDHCSVADEIIYCAKPVESCDLPLLLTWMRLTVWRHTQTQVCFYAMSGPEVICMYYINDFNPHVKNTISKYRLSFTLHGHFVTNIPIECPVMHSQKKVCTQTGFFLSLYMFLGFEGQDLDSNLFGIFYID